MRIEKIGNATLILGDCVDVLKTLDNNSIDSFISDPPYEYLDHELDRRFNHEIVFSEVDRLLKNDRLIAFFGRGFSFHKWNVFFDSIGYNFKESVVWNKDHNTSPYLEIGRVHEDISILSKGNCKINKIKNDYVEERISSKKITKSINDINRIKSGLNNDKELNLMLERLKNGICSYSSTGTRKHGVTAPEKSKITNQAEQALSTILDGLMQTSIITCKRDHYNTGHGTQKPVDLMERLIRLCTQENDVILDCFMGSGSTGVACVNTNRHFIGIERIPKYFDLTCSRIREAVNNKQHELFT